MNHSGSPTKRREAFIPELMEGLTPRALACQDRFIEIVKRGTTEKPIKSETIEKELGISGQEIRALSALLTMKGYEVTSRSHKPAGYWWALRPEEMLEKVHHLESREIAMRHHREAAIRIVNRLRTGAALQERLI